MALQLSKELDNGHTGNYWKVSKIDWTASDTAFVWVDLYKDSAARQGDKTPLKAERYKFDTFTVVNLEANYIIEFAYNQLKSLSNFTGATDV